LYCFSYIFFVFLAIFVCFHMSCEHVFSLVFIVNYCLCFFLGFLVYASWFSEFFAFDGFLFLPVLLFRCILVSGVFFLVHLLIVFLFISPLGPYIYLSSIII